MVPLPARLRLTILYSAVTVCLSVGCSTARQPASSVAVALHSEPVIERAVAESAAPSSATSSESTSTEVVSAVTDAPPAPVPPGDLLPAGAKREQTEFSAVSHAIGSSQAADTIPPTLGLRTPAGPDVAPPPIPDEVPAAEAAAVVEGLAVLEQIALTQNPELDRLQHLYGAALSRSRYADALPDPTVTTSVFGNPLETAAGSQRANMTVSQMIPWLGRLNAQEQARLLEALAVHAEYRAARLRVLADVQTAWFRLFVVTRQIDTTEANQELLASLIEVANARVATGAATQGDVLLGTLELSRLEEQLLTYRQQEESLKAALNQLLGRPADTPIDAPEKLSPVLPEWTHPELVQIALAHQPEIDAARLRTQASHWGIEVARLSRRPDFMLSSSWFMTDGNRPPSRVVSVGEDPWNVGLRVSIPLWDRKYDAMEQEAAARHLSARASVAQIRDRYDALLRDLWQQAQTAAATADLYEATILPQARQTLEADQQSYSNGSVDFERIIRDFRNVLTMELGYHQAVGQLAVTLARIEQAIGSGHRAAAE